MQNQSEMGFVKSLLDFKLTSFITMRVIRVLYTIFTVLILIAGVIFTLTGILAMFNGGGARGFLIVLLAPLGTLLYLIIVRLWIEFLANLYRIGDNTQKMVNALPKE